MTYRIFLANGTKCIRKFDNIEDAKAWCFVSDNGKKYRIEFKYESEPSARSIYI